MGTLLGPGHESAAIAYLNTWRVPNPPPTTSAHTLTTDVGEVHISTCVCCRAEPIQCQHEFGGYSFGQNYRCCWSRYCCGVASRGPHVLSEAFASYLGSGYQAKLIEYATFDLRLLKRCLQRTASSVFGSLDPFSLTEFVVNRLKGAETRDWMASRPALRKAIITNDLSMPGLVDVLANIVGVWPLIVSYLKENGRKDEGDSLVVRSFLVGICLTCGSVPITLCYF